jgi:NADPH:quinone reductase-like Zn-dependent oxidoreductase
MIFSIAIQLAVLAGFKVITTSSPAHFDSLKSLGAAAVIDRSSPNIVSELIAAAGGPVQYVIDAISLASTQEQGINILQSGGKLVLLLDADEKTVSSALERDISVSSAYGSSPSFPDFL